MMKPGDYPLRSAKSRAAVRSILAERAVKPFDGILVRLVRTERPYPPDKKCTCPKPPAGTFAICRCFCEGE